MPPPSPNNDRRVAVITGAARGQGRTHAVRLAQDGIDIVGIDLCQQLDSVPYPLATVDDLNTTVKQVESAGARMLAFQGDVRDLAQLQRQLDSAVAEFGRIDIVLANAGIAPLDDVEPDRPRRFLDVIEVNLIGVWNTMEAALPHLIAGGRGGNVVLTSSTAGLRGAIPGPAAGDGYVAAKHALVGLARNWANAYAKHNIRVNTVHPTGVKTPMVLNESLVRYHDADPKGAAERHNLLDVAAIDAEDVSAAIAWLVSDAARYITGAAIPIDAGWSARA